MHHVAVYVDVVRGKAQCVPYASALMICMVHTTHWQGFVPAWRTLPRRWLVKYLLANPDIMRGITRRPFAASTVNASVDGIKRLWLQLLWDKMGPSLAAVPRPPPMTGVGLPLRPALYTPNDAALICEMLFERFGDEGLCLPNEDHLRWHAETINWALAYMQAHPVDDSPAYFVHARTSTWFRRVSDTFAFAAEGIRAYATHVSHVAKGKCHGGTTGTHLTDH